MTAFGSFAARAASAAGGALSMLPDALGRRLRPARYRGMPEVVPTVEPMPEGRRRVLIGAMNTAGQAFLWARAIDDRPAVAALSVSRIETAFRFPVDVAVPAPLGLASADWQREHFRVRGLSATDVIIESGLPIFGPAAGWSLVREVRALQERGVRVVVICHGSDVRDVGALNARNPNSPYLLPEYAEKLTAMDRRSAAVRRAIRAAGVPVLGSTQGVLLDVPEASWCPVVVAPDEWATAEAPFSRPGPPLVVHAPSGSAVKGSRIIDPLLASLAEEGLVRYERLQGAGHDAVREAYRRADIMVDSIGTGGYGVAACEAMAAGRIVLSYVDPAYRERLFDDHSWRLPIVQIDSLTIERVLRDIVSDPTEALAVASAGPEYVHALHDGRASARSLLAALDLPAALGPRR